MNAVKGQFGRVVGGALLGPQQLAHLECVIEQPSAILERQTDDFVLLALPTDSNAEIDASTGQHIHGRQLFG